MNTIKILFAISTLLIANFVLAQNFTIIDNFADRSKFVDISLLETWGAAPLANGRTAFRLSNKTAGSITNQAVSLLPEALTFSGLTGADQLKTMSAIDYVFPTEIDRRSTTVEIVFDAVWDALNSGGESGRFVITLLNDYPAGGAVTGDINNMSNLAAFGRPIYNVRIRNSNTTNGSLILYGAGNNTPSPAWEKDGTGTQWLPGFSQQSCFGSPGAACSPAQPAIATLPSGIGNNYPNTGTRRSTSVITSTTQWRTYRILFEPYRISLFSRLSTTTGAWQLSERDNFMEIPDDADPLAYAKINTAHGTNVGIGVLPYNYDWFQFAEAIRFYWRAGGGSNNSYMANLSIIATQDPLLPLKIYNWKATRTIDSKIRLEWNNSESRYFDVQHSTNGRQFNTIASGIVNKEANNSFSYLHQNPSTGKNYYRLVSKDLTNKQEYSSILMVNNNNGANVPSLIPNPTKNQFRIEGLEMGTSYQLRISDIQGRILKNQWISNNQVINNYDLKQGMYFYEILESGSKILSGRLLIN